MNKTNYERFIKYQNHKIVMGKRGKSYKDIEFLKNFRNGPLTWGEIQQATGMSKAGLADRLNEYMEAGVLRYKKDLQTKRRVYELSSLATIPKGLLTLSIGRKKQVIGELIEYEELLELTKKLGKLGIFNKGISEETLDKIDPEAKDLSDKLDVITELIEAIRLIPTKGTKLTFTLALKADQSDIEKEISEIIEFSKKIASSKKHG